jgi:cell division protein FtsA
MNNRNIQTYLDFGNSKIRAGTFVGTDQSDIFYNESKFCLNHLSLNEQIQNIITSLEKDSNEYINNINLMIDSQKMLSIGISISKKIDGSILKQEDVQFLIQEAKQQISKNYRQMNIVHIIINNYKVNDTDYTILPNESKCFLISLDILFICFPNDTILNFKNIFSNFNILINQIICSSYAKSMNYKKNLNLTGNTSFIDIGFNKTAIISFHNDKLLFIDTLPIGGNQITKDISKILNVGLEEAEAIKINTIKNIGNKNNTRFSNIRIEKIILARIEEILELSIKSIESNSFKSNLFRIFLTGNGSKILNNDYKQKTLISEDLVILEDATDNICKSGLQLGMGLNKQEVLVVPKKHIKQGFFEKLFHFFN